MNIERKVKEELSVILNNKTAIERRNFIKEINAYLYIADRKITDTEIEKSLIGRQQVYNYKKR